MAELQPVERQLQQAELLLSLLLLLLLTLNLLLQALSAPVGLDWP